MSRPGDKVVSWCLSLFDVHEISVYIWEVTFYFYELFQFLYFNIWPSHPNLSNCIRGLALWRMWRPLLVHTTTHAVPWSCWKGTQEWRKAHLASLLCASPLMTKHAPHQVSVCVCVFAITSTWMLFKVIFQVSKKGARKCVIECNLWTIVLYTCSQMLFPSLFV